MTTKKRYASALLVATVPNAWASLRAGHLRYQTYIAGSVRRRRMWLLHRLMAERASAPELRSYGLRRFLLDQYDRVMAVETDIELALARRVTTTVTVTTSPSCRRPAPASRTRPVAGSRATSRNVRSG